MTESDPRFVVELLRVVQRENASGFESVREELKRIREGIERLALDQEDTAQRVAALETSARRRAARK